MRLCMSLGAEEKDLVPFDKYAAAANGLASPSSAARALYAKAGFAEAARRKGYYAKKDAPAEDAIVMRCTLGAA